MKYIFLWYYKIVQNKLLRVRYSAFHGLATYQMTFSSRILKSSFGWRSSLFVCLQYNFFFPRTLSWRENAIICEFTILLRNSLRYSRRFLSSWSSPNNLLCNSKSINDMGLPKNSILIKLSNFLSHRILDQYQNESFLNREMYYHFRQALSEV